MDKLETLCEEFIHSLTADTSLLSLNWNDGEDRECQFNLTGQKKYTQIFAVAALVIELIAGK